KTESLRGEGAVDVVPLELYDSARAKIDANLRWLFAKAYGIGRERRGEARRAPVHLLVHALRAEAIVEPFTRMSRGTSSRAAPGTETNSPPELLQSKEHEEELEEEIQSLFIIHKIIACAKSPKKSMTEVDYLDHIIIDQQSVYLDHIPEDLRDPFYTDQYEQEHIKPPVIRLLLSSELYCSVCGLILKGDQVASLQSHQAVVQALSRKGIYVMESDDSPVSEADLACTPIKMSAHIAMIDALMMAYTVEMISIEKVVASVKRFSTFSASKELPFDLEDAMVFWINKVNLKLREITEKELKLKQHLLESPSHQKVRYRRDHLSGRQLPYFPLLEDLMKDVCDGAALLAVVHYYCPDHMKLDDICLKEVTSIADSLYNIQLLKEFANEYLNKGFYLTIEDMLYAPLVLKVVRPDFVQPRDLQEIKDARAMVQAKSARPTVPISNATKRSFLVTPGSGDTMASVQSPDICNSNKGSPALGASHPLLPLRQRQQKSLQGEEASGYRNRSNSLTRVDGHPKGALLAWPDKKQRPMSQPTPYATDSDADMASGDSISLARSISKDSLASNVINVTPSHQSGGTFVHVGPRRPNGQGPLGRASPRDEEEEEELVAIIRSEKGPGREDPDLQSMSLKAARSRSPRRRQEEVPAEPQADSFYLEPLMPALLKPAKEKSVNPNKEEECGEGRSRSSTRRAGEGPMLFTRKKVCSAGPSRDLNRTFTPISSTEFVPATESVELPAEGGSDGAFTTEVTSSVDSASREQSCGFFLHTSDSSDKVPLAGHVRSSPFSTASLAWEVSKDSDSEVADMDEEEQDPELTPAWQKALGEGEESLKLQEDMKVREHEDKDGGSGRSSPCLSTTSQASSVASGSVRMTSFAERKLQKAGTHDGRSSTSSSQKTTPDGSESCPLSLTTWRMRREQSPTLAGKDGASVLASELVQLHMQLEEKRRAIEMQKKKMESLSARQRLKLGKAAFLNIVKKGKSDTLPQPLKSDHYSKEEQKLNGEKESSSKDDSCVDALRGRAKDREGQEGKAAVRWNMDSPPSPCSLEMDNKANGALLLDDGAPEPDLNECNRSIEMLNEAINAIQQQMMQLSLQQDLLMKQNIQSPPSAPHSPSPVSAPDSVSASPFANGKNNGPEPKIRPAVHFVEPISTSGSSVVRRPPKLSSSRGPRSKPIDLKLSKENGKPVSRVITPTQSVETLPHLRQFPGGRIPKGDTEDSSSQSVPPAEAVSTLERGNFRSTTFRLHDEANQRTVVPKETSSITQEPSLEEYQRKAEEARLRKQQLEVESELKRDEARRKAEEDRIRKEEEKARRELIKQEYLRRKQQEMIEEQGLSKPKTKPKKQRPKSVHRAESSSDTYSKCSSTPLDFPADNLSSAQSGSSLSLASAATTEAESVHSGGTGSQRGESVESFPVLSRNASRNTERDWENASTASSITSVAEYSGPKLFKEPSAKSNKPIIHNAIAHCCLAGKVNEPQKNSILEELEKCESNHLMILFRDGGCQFRALYSFFPDTEEIHKLTGTGPKSISKKMIDKLYKYSSDRKQFTVIPAKTVSVSVDALTIHNHLWQVKRPAAPRKSGK
ncbi:calmodulin-regulated spectrin-associated protein 1-like, partial [Scleropages formosus]